MKALIPFVLALGAGACVAPPGAWTQHGYDTYGTRNPRPELESEYPLYSRDGGVVEAPAAGKTVTREQAEPRHDVEGEGSGRMYILELYQAAIDERDALTLEVAALSTALEHETGRVEALEAELARMRTANATLEGETRRLRAEHQELAARLVTAQIRRLESEKLLLEGKLEWYGSGGAVDAKASNDPASTEPATRTEPTTPPMPKPEGESLGTP